MICEACGKNPATVHITDNPNDKKKKRETHLCDACAKEKSPIQSLTQVMGGLLVQPASEEEASALADVTCPRCGMTYSEFRSCGRFGCSEDYSVFKKALIPFFEKIHGNNRHMGKSPSHLSRAAAVDQRLTLLQREMEKSIQEEDFERAADLRDRIKDLKEKKDGTR
ncbi:MAG: UvrB/UvrC motif-containing protein [Planctomycetes bacterium]|nr:UvrB/UvrC motif-containing protein [Planctomycetota bacterium]